MSDMSNDSRAEISCSPFLMGTFAHFDGDLISAAAHLHVWFGLAREKESRGSLKLQNQLVSDTVMKDYSFREGDELNLGGFSSPVSHFLRFVKRVVNLMCIFIIISYSDTAILHLLDM